MTENVTSTDGTDHPLAGLRELVRNSSPRGEDWCPNCEEYLSFEQLQVVERAEFGVRNVVKGCPNCRYSCINQTEWVEVGPSSTEDKRCGYCENPREQHPVYDDNGGLACSGMERWF